MPSKRTILLSLLLALLPLLAAWQVSAETPTANGVKISEIKLGGGSDPKEFVELFNDSSNAVDLAGLQLEYAKATFSPASCDTPSWKAAANPATMPLSKP